MANTRGGLLIYGVSDDINMAGLDLSTVDDKQLGQWLRVHLQPTVNGVSYLKLEATDGSGKDVLVVDAPSETAPHFSMAGRTRTRATRRSTRPSATGMTPPTWQNTKSPPTATASAAKRPPRQPLNSTCTTPRTSCSTSPQTSPPRG
ncbi:helix-turn-helix domain-containing protein [Streptomyces sp. NPDC005548]|uniref:AlbA family DNA-binding domain-containing protein n=1 Tax=Streptomyces sp. NPDC005548 TaxID=3364724 RepID=UPI0036B85739